MANVESVLLGPMGSGTIKNTAANGDVGYCVLTQTKTITVPVTAVTLDTIFYLPPTAKIIDILIDLTVQSDNSSTAALTIGATSTGTTYVSSFDCKGSTGRTRPTFTAAQLIAMANIGTNTAVYATIVAAGTGTVGTVIVTIVYMQI